MIGRPFFQACFTVWFNASFCKLPLTFRNVIGFGLELISKDQRWNTNSEGFAITLLFILAVVFTSPFIIALKIARLE